MGRACVHREHRNLVVLGLLWKGIADYARYKVGFTKGWGCPECSGEFPHYTSGWSCAGAFLLYLDKTYGSNVVRHARASAVHVTLAEQRGEFELRIRDNGCGVTDAQLSDPRAIGLLGMRERAALVGGTFLIAGRRGKGTSITVRVPLTTRQPKPLAARGRRPAPRRHGR